MAREQEIPVLEAETILEELQELLLGVEDEISTDLDIETLDTAVDEQIGE
jgi:division protein CdvB (Snf7/Vps24/ESCRT-III family)